MDPSPTASIPRFDGGVDCQRISGFWSPDPRLPGPWWVSRSPVPDCFVVLRGTWTFQGFASAGPTGSSSWV